MFFSSHIDAYYLRSVYHLFLISSWCSDQLLIPFNCSASSYNLLLAILPLQCCQRVVHTAILSVTPSPTVGHSPGAIVEAASAEPVGQHQSSPLSPAAQGQPLTQINSPPITHGTSASHQITLLLLIASPSNHSSMA